MTEILAGFNVPAIYVVVFLAVLLLVNLYLVLTNLRKRYMLWWSKNAAYKIERRFKEEYARQLVIEQHFDTKIAELEQRLVVSESMTSKNEEDVGHLRVEVSSSMETAERGAAMILGDFKKQLVRGICNIEKLEETLGVADSCEISSSGRDDTLSYRVQKLQTAVRAKRVTENRERPSLLSGQLILPGLEGLLDASRAMKETQPRKVLTLVSN